MKKEGKNAGMTITNEGTKVTSPVDSIEKEPSTPEEGMATALNMEEGNLSCKRRMKECDPGLIRGKEYKY